MLAEADGLAESSVIPRSFSRLTWPRSTVRVPVQPAVHQSVPASPSIAFDAGWPDSVVVAVAVAELASAQLTVGAAFGAAAARAGDGEEEAAAVTSGMTRTSAAMPSPRRQPRGVLRMTVSFDRGDLRRQGCWLLTETTSPVR